jgi:hypothetical protein
MLTFTLLRFACCVPSVQRFNDLILGFAELKLGIERISYFL